MIAPGRQADRAVLSRLDRPVRAGGGCHRPAGVGAPGGPDARRHHLGAGLAGCGCGLRDDLAGGLEGRQDPAEAESAARVEALGLSSPDGCA
ncbi:hypothetical protein GCM10018952_60430 [Streptosporangium vulgare]